MGADAIAVVGGAEVYGLALAEAQTVYLTEVDAAPEGDALFPPFDRSAFREVRRTTIRRDRTMSTLSPSSTSKAPEAGPRTITAARSQRD